MLSEGREWVEIDTHIPIREITFEATLQTPVTNTLRLFAEDLSGVSALFYRNDAGAKINLSGGLTGSGVAGRVAFWTGTTPNGFSSRARAWPEIGFSPLRHVAHGRSSSAQSLPTCRMASAMLPRE